MNEKEKLLDKEAEQIWQIVQEGVKNKSMSDYLNLAMLKTVVERVTNKKDNVLAKEVIYNFLKDESVRRIIKEKIKENS